MAVMAREKWTDERLDDLNLRVEKGFDEVKGEVREVRVEIRSLRAEMNERFSSVDSRFDAMQRTMVIGFASIVASVVGAVVAGLALG